MDLIANYSCVTGEGPLWHSDRNLLYWIDIPNGRLFQYDPKTEEHQIVFEGPQIGGFTIQTDGKLLLFMEKGSIAKWSIEGLETVVEGIGGEEDSRFNDVIAAPNGSVFCGTMPTESHSGTLYRLDKDGSLRPVVENVGISNGLGFTANQDTMYYTDSTARTIYRYRIDPKTAELSACEEFIVTPNDGSIPDGMTVDSEDHIWSARWDGFSLYRYSPDGNQVLKIEFETKKVSCVTFGGIDYRDMYVTTAGANNLSENGQSAGSLYRLNPGITGKEEFRSAICV